MQYWIDKLEKYYEDIPTHLQPEVREFLDEYYEKKDTHSATSLDGLSDEELGELLYLTESNGPEFNYKQFSKKFPKCINLKILILDDVGIEIQDISHLTHLRILSWSFDKDDFFTLKILEKLIVLDIYNDIEPQYTEDGFWENFIPFKNRDLQLPSILYLGLSGIDNFIDFQSLNYLVGLDLNSYSFKNLPIELNKFEYLKELSLRNNNISFISNRLFDLLQLEILDVSMNEIYFLPKEILNLKKLRKLDISYNEIQDLPNELFSLKNLETILFSNNPYEKSNELKMISQMIGEVGENEMPIFNLLKNQSNSSSTDNYNYFTLKVPKTLQTPMLQYIEFFKDYVEGAKGKEIIFDVKRDTEGLILVTNGNAGVSLPELGEYFKEYVSLVGLDLEKWIPNFETFTTRNDADIFRLKVENQVESLRASFRIAKVEHKYFSDRNKELSKQLVEKGDEIAFLRNLVNNLQNDIKFLVHGRTAETLDVDQLLLDIINQLIKMQEGKYSQQLENLHNDILTQFLREKGYTADHTRSGRSASGLRVGEIDIMIRKKDGTPFSIIEAFRLESCGEKNKIVAKHLDKLIHDYDTAGHQRNFAIIYAEAQNFEKLWENYQIYVSELNGKPDFQAKYPLISFKENTEVSQKSSIKIGVAKHRREGSIVEIYHIFVNMFA